MKKYIAAVLMALMAVSVAAFATTFADLPGVLATETDTGSTLNAKIIIGENLSLIHI